MWRNMASLLSKANYSLARMLSEFVAQSLRAPLPGLCRADLQFDFGESLCRDLNLAPLSSFINTFMSQV